MENRREKPKKIKQERGLKLFCLLGGNDSRISRLSRFFVGAAISLTIDGAVLTRKEVVVNLSKLFL